jgi:hypothetical protein
MNWAVYLFWASALLVAYSYIGYLLWLWVRCHWCFRPVHESEVTPSVSIVIAAHNEATTWPRKLSNLSELHYPQHLLETVWVGS